MALERNVPLDRNGRVTLEHMPRGVPLRLECCGTNVVVGPFSGDSDLGTIVLPGE